jgi:hypothetical protein
MVAVCKSEKNVAQSAFDFNILSRYGIAFKMSAYICRITGGINLIVTAVLMLVQANVVTSAKNEMCDFSSIRETGADDLLSTLRGKVHGQPMAAINVAMLIRNHWTDSTPTNALMLSFHGPTGTGKTYVSRLAADSLYVHGIDSTFVHRFSLTSDFTDVRKLPDYRQLVRDKIIEKLRACPRSMFIFEEFDKDGDIAQGLADIIIPFLEPGPDAVQGVSSKKAIFIFTR